MATNSITATAEAKADLGKKGRVREFCRRLVQEQPLGTFGGIMVLVFFIVGIFADYLAPYGIFQRNLAHILEGPSLEFPLGTDQFGRDLLSRIIHGAQISMIVGVGSGVLQIAIATVFGLISGYWGGNFDLILQRIVDAIMCFPWLFLTLTIMALLGPGIVQLIVVIGFQWGIANIRTMRGVVLSVRESEYVTAARGVGCPTWRILILHILPQLYAPIIVLFTISLGGNILAEATISFLGFGVPPPQPTWGGMLSLEGRIYLLQNPWMAIWPGLGLALVVYGVNMFGDALRDLLDPRLRGGIGRYGLSFRKKKE